VVLEHDGGVRTRSAHLSSLEVEVGDRVSAGQMVGAVGATGRVTRPHLHFEVIHGQQRLDPIRAVRRFSEALKKVEQVADLNDGGSTIDPEIALE
jgi:murein DD-endopeptidase MepM/ murein hydrolase activator NlpD